MPESVQTVLGFDFGSHWIGTAVGQTLTQQASPLKAIKSGDWRTIEKLLQDWQPQRVIVGLPMNDQGGPQEMTARAQRFSRQLEGRFGIKAELTDERLTTREAYQIAIESNQFKSKLEIDCIAAVLITESWLRSYQKNDENPEN